MDDLELLQAFVSSYLSSRSTLISNSDLRVEPISDTLQLLAKTEGLVATAKLSGEVRCTSMRFKSRFWPQLHEAMVAKKCLPIRPSAISGFYEYEPVEIPEGYHVRFTDSLDLLQTWWSFKKSDKPLPLMSLLFLHRGIWYPIHDLICEHGTLTLKTPGHKQQIYPLDMLVWLQQAAPLSLSSTVEAEVQAPKPQATYSAQSAQYASLRRRAASSHYPDSKRIGGYLMDAGLLSPAQVEVVLADQEITGMRFGEILVSRGWLKAQTIEFLFKNVILPHRNLAKQAVVKQVDQETAEPVAEEHLPHPSSSPSAPQPDLKVLEEQETTPPLLITPSPQQQELSTNAASLEPASEPTLATSEPKFASQTEEPDPLSISSNSPRLLSIHDRETLATYDKLYLEDLPDWLELDIQDAD